MSVAGHSGMRVVEPYVAQVFTSFVAALRRLIRAPSHARKDEGRRRVARHSLIVFVAVAFFIFILMLLADAATIGLMPPRRDPSLWPLRILTEFSKSAYVLYALVASVIAALLLLPRLKNKSRLILVAVSTRLQFLLLSVAVTDLVVEVLKSFVGRGRPFVGEIGVFNFSPFEGTEAFKSLPSSHASTAWALAFAVSFLWPRLTPVMWIYALIMCACRVVLLAHHPSDVVAGALIAAVCTLFVRYWFAARRLAFMIRPDGTIVPLPGPSLHGLKGVARKALGS